MAWGAAAGRGPGTGAAGLAGTAGAAARGAAGAAPVGRAAGFAGAAGPPGSRSCLPHLHLTILPAAVSGASSTVLHPGHLIFIEAAMID
jgi:hypothetical protein